MRESHAGAGKAPWEALIVCGGEGIMSRKRIIIVDDSRADLSQAKSFLEDRFEVVTAVSGEELFSVLGNFSPDLILLDVEMPVLDGYTVIKMLRADQKYSGIPVIFIAGRNDPASELQGLNLGAVDYVYKPFSLPLLKKRIEMHVLIVDQNKKLMEYGKNLHKLVDEKVSVIKELHSMIFEIMKGMMNHRGVFTDNSASRVRKNFEIFLSALKHYGVYQDEISKWDTNLLCFSSQLYDIGKVGISDAVLLKPGRLDQDELNEMRRHTGIGEDIIKRVDVDGPEGALVMHARIMAATHHEKWDGTGYPLGLGGQSIPLQGRIIALVDVYEALVSDRPYKPAFSHKEAVEIIADNGGTHFDPALVEVFVKVADQFRSEAAPFQ